VTVDGTDELKELTAWRW